MPDGKWVSKANLQTFWQMIRSKVIPTMIGDTVTTWLTEHVDPVGSAVVVDDTLTIQGAAADAKKTGDEISGLKEELSDVNAVLSDDADLLSGSLSDKSTTSNGVTYTLSGSTVTINGTAMKQSAFAVLGSTTAPPPSWLKSGKKYIVNLENATPAEMHLQAKTAAETNLLDVALYKESGRYIFTVPENITVFRILLTVQKNEVADGTLKAEIFNTEIEDIKNDYFELATDNCPMIPDNSDINTYTTAGTYKITNNAHAATMTNMPESVPGKLVVIATTQASRLMQIYFPVNGSAYIFIRSYDASGWGNWRSVISSDKYSIPVLIGNYATDSGDTTEKLSIYVPAKSGYIRYEMRHFVSDTKNCNGWQIYHAYRLNSFFSGEVDLTISGEWECALHLDGRDDFSGGITHGDEIMESITCLVDGIPTTISGLTARRNAKEVRIIETSILYDPADHTTQIAEHGKEYVFTKDGLTIEQSVKWLISASLTNCFLAMFLPSKNYIDRATANSDFKVLELASSTSERQATIVKQKANAINMWDTGSGFSANISTPIYPTGLTGGDQISIGDNNGNPYNKLYFKVCGGGSSSVGELWKSKSVYKLDFSN